MQRRQGTRIILLERSHVEHTQIFERKVTIRVLSPTFMNDLAVKLYFFELNLSYLMAVTKEVLPNKTIL